MLKQVILEQFINLHSKNAQSTKSQSTNLHPSNTHSTNSMSSVELKYVEFEKCTLVGIQWHKFVCGAIAFPISKLNNCFLINKFNVRYCDVVFFNTHKFFIIITLHFSSNLYLYLWGNCFSD